MKTVLLKSRAASAGGLEKHAERIAHALLERGDEVTLLTTGEASAINKGGKKVTICASEAKPDQSEAVRVRSP